MPIVINQKRTFLQQWDAVSQTMVSQYTIQPSQNRNVWCHFDGRYMNITNMTSLNVRQYVISTNGLQFAGVIPIGINPFGLWGDGRFFWAITSAGVLHRIDPKTGTTIETITLTAGIYRGLSGDGRFLYTYDDTPTFVIVIDPSTGTEVSRFNVVNNTQGVHVDGRYLWVHRGIQNQVGRVAQYEIPEGRFIKQFTVFNQYPNTSGSNACGITGDDRFLWITLRTEAQSPSF